MRKFFTFTAALLASFSLWAAEPDFESYDWQSQAEAEAVAGDHDGIVISYAGLGNLGNVGGHWYIPNNQNLKNSDSSWKYFGIAANAQIDSVAFLYCPNGSDATNIAWAAWGKDVTPNQYILGHGVTTGTTSSKSWDNAIWETIDLTGIEAYTVYMSRSIREFREIDGTSNIPNFGGGKTINILGVRVWLHETKTIVSTTEELINAKVNGEALEEGKLNDLKYEHTATLDDYFITAPEVTFVKRVEITYDDQSTKVDTVDVDVTAIESLEYSGMWQASFTIGETTYSLIAGIAEAYTVTYLMREGSDEIVLGTELVAVGEHPADYAQYENRPLYTFDGWYDSDYIEQVDLSTEVINSDATYYAAFSKAYVYSINIEQLVMDNGKGYDIRSAFNAANIDYKNIDQLDSLNNSKGAARNEPYLGLKIKKQGGYIACNMMPGQTIRIKFGYVKDAVNLIVNNDTTSLTPENNTLSVVEYSATEDAYLKIQTTTNSTVVIKQIMADEQPGYVLYPINYAPAENGSVSGWTVALPGEQVFLTFAPAENYIVMDCHANDFQIIGTPDVQESFIMPAAEVTVTAVFSLPTAIERTEENMNAVKALENGQLIIRKNGVKYNAQGARF